MTHVTLPTLDQLKAASALVGEVLGAVYTLCTIIGNPLAKYSTGRLAAFGHLVLAFGADISKAQKRFTELFASSEPV